MKSTEKRPKLSDTIATIRKRFGTDAIMKLNEKPRVDVDTIPTGSVGLDWALGVGGLPRGRLVEIFGPEASGKTTLALHIVAEAQKRGGTCAYIDAEHAMDPEYAKKIGVKTDELFISQPSGGEESLQIVDQIVKDGTFAVVVIDSVAMLTPKHESDGQIGDMHMGGQARMMSQAMRILTEPTAKSKTLVIFINQIRMQIGAWGPNPETTSGGKALKFAASVRLDIRRIATIKTGETPVGSRVRVKVVKNKVAAPFKQTEFDILYGEGISREGEILALGELLKVIDRSGGAVYTYGENKLGRGYDNARQFLKENPLVADAIASDIRKIHTDI